ncbi:MAG: BatA domain-containing protein, partial [Verrucomicrobia bacterium]|nr:BatA domain-containing protein [Verrucomicrobiota bacterium]
MTFLQPWMLWGLAAAALPVLIHLLNRLRYRRIAWAAMQFLIQATRSSTRNARLRHYLILACRTLAVAAFLLLLARPISGGWLGATLAGAPDMVIVALDRSASMEAADPRLQQSRRERALALLASAPGERFASTRFVLLDSATAAPQEIAGAAALPGLALTGPTDTAADIPSLVRAAADLIARDRPGRVEIWIASDLQASN